MGNCLFKRLGGRVVEEIEMEMEMVKVVTSSGGIMELYGPITAQCITNEFPGHAIFRSPHPSHISDTPLLHDEELRPGRYYHLLPRHYADKNTGTSAESTPYRMSAENKGMLKRTYSEAVDQISNAGVWKVRLVISSDQLSEILSQEARTEALIESVRTVAKCATSAINSDHWSWNTATEP
ncbi:hypothetical protein CDL12_04753 [Handroanthus impetiginosus]|uniref:Uncharacterized protein n=1 Tax=Handroanthus impetiginosus TaxID=429701 RepID=A0A2G9HYC8_9LAMI|nr:hypothetical protein CDL12_04753 [Handroanthus impetiginosus]